MFAPRARIGSISPTVAETLFYDFYRFAPVGVGLVGVTCSIERLEQEEFEKVFNVVEDACRYLASRDVQFVVHHGTPLVVSQGHGFDYQLMERMEKATGGIPVVTSVRAQLEAMRSLGMKSIVIATPYPQEINEAAARFAEADGFTVANLARIDVPFKMMQAIEDSRIVELAGEALAAAPGADGLWMPCPQWTVCDVTQEIEDALGKPVVAGSAADFWYPLRALGIDDPIEGFGRLLASLQGETVKA